LNKKMRILYHHRTRSTDAQRIHIREIVRALQDLGHNVEIISLIPLDKAEQDAARDAGDPFWKRWVRRIPYSYELLQLAYNLAGIPMLAAAMLRGRAAFIYERYSLFNFTGLVVARLFGVPLILEVNSPFALEQSRDREIRAEGLACWSERFICTHATRVIAVSTPLARILASSGVPANCITVMSNGVSIEDFQPGSADRALARQLGLDGCAVIGFVGWFRNWHGLDLLLQAFHEGRLAALGAKLLLIGDGPAMPGLQTYVRDHQLEGDVVFSGPVPHADVPRYLDLIDIAVQPSANEYCCPMKILEYMALGKAIVAPRQENIQELLREHEEAEFFLAGDVQSMKDALREVARESEKCRQLGGRARAAVFNRGYLWSSNAGRVIALARAGSTSMPPECVQRENEARL
jgi:glycosyltransferase involved in cell wall biosynthesis